MAELRGQRPALIPPVPSPTRSKRCLVHLRLFPAPKRGVEKGRLDARHHLARLGTRRPRSVMRVLRLVVDKPWPTVKRVSR